VIISFEAQSFCQTLFHMMVAAFTDKTAVAAIQTTIASSAGSSGTASIPQNHFTT
jgi:hypothetical protein